MLTIIIIFFIGRSFYRLAHDYNRNRWLFALLGIGSYYAGTFIFGIFLGLICDLYQSNFLETTPSLVLNLIALPIGGLSAWGFYSILHRVWEKQLMTNNEDTLDGNLINQ